MPAYVRLQSLSLPHEIQTNLLFVDRLTDGAAAQMWWTRVGFYHHITVRHNVVIIGWPEGVKFERPSRAGYSVGVLTDLLHGWRTGKTRFRRVDNADVRRLGEEIGPKPVRSPRYMDQRYQLRRVETRAKHKDVRYHLSSSRYVREDTPEA